MGSRIKEDVSNFFICFCEVARPESAGRDAWIIQKIPDSYKEVEVLKCVPKFAYPCEFENSNVQYFSFVLTNLDSKWTFGFSRHDPKTETALVFLSYLPWHEVFVKLLNCIAEIIRNGRPEELETFLNDLYHSKVPDTGANLTISYNNEQSKFVCQGPELFRLPKIPDNRNLTEYYSAVENSNMLVVFASMLNERRIVFVSRRLDRLSSCVQAANSLIYPMHWQHIFIPILPTHLTDYLLAPMPFLIGVPTAIWQDVKKADVGDVVVLDLDSNSISTPFADLDSLPQDIVKFLKTQLKNRTALLNDGFARVFLRALVQLIGGYRDALKFQQGQKITFSEECFLESRPPNMQPFLKDMLNLQIFRQFIEERLDMLNAGLGFSDEFELEMCHYSDKSSNKIKAQYKEWVSTAQRQGTAFFKTVKNKANPAVKSAVKSVKEKGKDVKTAYRGIRSKIRKEQGPGPGQAMSLQLGKQPRSAPSSPTSHRARPMTFDVSAPVVVQPTHSFLKQKRAGAPLTRSSHEYVPLSPPSDDLMSPPAEMLPAAGGLSLPRLDMDLMGDLEEVMSRKCALLDQNKMAASPPVDRTLKPVRSLELAGGSFQHVSLASTSSLPLTSTNPFAFPLFPASSPSTGFTFPDVVPRRPSFPQPSIPANNTRKHYEADLIRLDSIPKEESFDPLEESSPADPTPVAFPTGLTNPLYPYYKLNGAETAAANNVNKSFLHGQASVANTRLNKQDLDLLKEYGIEFQSNANIRTDPDPFENTFDNAMRVQRVQSNWATFD